MWIFELLLWFIGFGLLLYADWRIAIGVFFVLWANNTMISDLKLRKGR